MATNLVNVNFSMSKKYMYMLQDMMESITGVPTKEKLKDGMDMYISKMLENIEDDYKDYLIEKTKDEPEE